jgi:hypothetical protein
VFLFLYTDDFWRYFNSYTAKGIVFIRDPKGSSRTTGLDPLLPLANDWYLAPKIRISGNQGKTGKNPVLTWPS